MIYYNLILHSQYGVPYMLRVCIHSTMLLVLLFSPTGKVVLYGTHIFNSSAVSSVVSGCLVNIHDCDTCYTQLHIITLRNTCSNRKNT